MTPISATQINTFRNNDAIVHFKQCYDHADIHGNGIREAWVHVRYAQQTWRLE